MEKEIYKKIISKKEFSQLPEKDVEMAFSHFEKRQTSDGLSQVQSDQFDDELVKEKIKLTRDLLRKTFSVFSSNKIFSLKQLEKHDEMWFLKKHISTRERFDFYEKVYGKIFSEIDSKKISVIDLGCGINGFSYNFMKKFGIAEYVGVEAMGQLSEVQNKYFEKKKINGKIFHESLFNLEEIKKIILATKKPRIIFLFKVLDSLEMLERDYSKKILKEIIPLADFIVVSFATRSLVSRKKFFVNRNWIFNFVKENFHLVDDFEIGAERYIIIKNN